MIQGELEPRLLTTAQVARLLGVSERSVRTLRERRKITFIKVAGKVMHPRDAVDEFIVQNTVRASCHEGAVDHTSSSGKSEVSTTFDGTRAATPECEARVRAIYRTLKSPSPNSSGNAKDLGGSVSRHDFQS